MKAEQEMDRWSDPKKWNDLKPKEEMVISLEQLRTVSDLHYGKNKKERKRAKKLFESLDGDGDGWITKEDVTRSEKMLADFGKSFLKRAFKGLDRDGDGYLSFEDSKSLLYMAEMSKRRCRACGRSLPYGHGFCCERCVQEQGDEFSLCYGCFGSRGIEHFGHGYLHFLHDFAFLEKRLESSVPSSPSPPPDHSMKQCIVCGDFHKSNAPGFMCNAHMCPMPNSNGEYVCEWCFCYFCYKCGNPFRDNPNAAIPGKWLQRFQCSPCSKKQTWQDLYSTIIQRYEELLSDATIVKECKTCKINQRNGRLFWYINGRNMLKPNSNAPQTQHQIQTNRAALVRNSLSTIINVQYAQQQGGKALHQFQGQLQPQQLQPQQLQPQQPNGQQNSNKTVESMKTAVGIVSAIARGSMDMPGMALKVLSGTLAGGQGGHGHGHGHGHGYGQGHGHGQGLVNYFAEGILDALGQNLGQNLGQGLDFAGDLSSVSGAILDGLGQNLGLGA